MYNIMYETSRQSRFDARYWMLGLVHWDDPEGGYGEGGGRKVQDGEHRYTCGRFISIFDKTNIVKFKNKIKFKKIILLLYFSIFFVYFCLIFPEGLLKFSITIYVFLLLFLLL